jgi:flagellar motor protein MotB
VLAATKGEYAPRVSNETTAGQAENRRVELHIMVADGNLERDLRRVLEN